MRACKTIDERFWPKVNKTDDCWEWLASEKGNGYGGFYIGDKILTSHRVSWEIHNGKIPEGMCVLHKCDNRLCVNPKHLFVGTALDNYIDMVNKGRSKTGKGEGHVFAKLTAKQVLEIRQLHKSEQLTHREIGIMYNISRRNINDIINKKTWKHI